MRGRPAAIAAFFLVIGTGLTPASAAAVDECLGGTPGVTTNGYRVEPILTDSRLPVPIGVSGPGEIDCTDMTATVQKTDGSLRTTVALTEKGGLGMPPSWTRYGLVTLELSTGAGDWVITKITHGTAQRVVQVPFRVRRGSVITIDQPPTTTGTTKTPITGLVRNYTATGVLAPTANATVKVMHLNRTSLIASAKTTSTGRYSVQVPFTQTTTMMATTPGNTAFASAWTGAVTATKRLTMSALTAAATANVNVYWRVSGTAAPGAVWTTLDYWNGTAWTPTHSFGPVAANGAYTRWWKPTAAGTFRLRVTVSGGRLENSPLSREVSVKVTQLPQQPTYLDGFVGPTAGPPVLFNTKMSTFGHLRIRQADGSTAPVAGELVQILAKTATETTWTPVAGARTGSTGYFYTNWYVSLTPGTYAVQARYVTTLPRAASSSRTIGSITVQP